MKILFLFLISIFSLIFASNWSDPKTLMSVEGKTILYGAFTDSSNNKTHFLFRTEDDDELFYLCMLHGRIQHLSQLGNTLKDAFITGKENGQHIFVSFTNMDGHVEFLESDTEGKTWKPAQTISKTDNCTIHSLVYMTETGRLYALMGCNNTIIFASRAAGSSIFSFERNVISEEHAIHSVSSCYTYRRGAPLIHIIWTTSSEIWYSQSIDNGISWSGRFVIPISISHLGSTDVKMISNYGISKVVFIMYKNNQEPDIKLLYSLDNCDSFSKTIPIDTKWPQIEIFGTSTNKRLVTVGNKYQEWFNWETNELKGIEYEVPFDLNSPAILGKNTNFARMISLIGAFKSDNTILGTSYKIFEDFE